jgi:hypothetical protein
MKCDFNKYMGLFVPLYGPFRACLKRVVLVSAHGPRPRPGTKIFRGVSCLGRAFFPCFGSAHQAWPKCTPIGAPMDMGWKGSLGYCINISVICMTTVSIYTIQLFCATQINTRHTGFFIWFTRYKPVRCNGGHLCTHRSLFCDAIKNQLNNHNKCWSLTFRTTKIWLNDTINRNR